MSAKVRGGEGVDIFSGGIGYFLMFTCRHISFTWYHPYIPITKKWDLKKVVDFWFWSVYAGYLALTLESQKCIISVFLTGGVLSRFLTKFVFKKILTKFLNIDFWRQEKQLIEVNKRVQNSVFVITTSLGLKVQMGNQEDKTNIIHSITLWNFKKLYHNHKIKHDM